MSQNTNFLRALALAAIALPLAAGASAVSVPPVVVDQPSACSDSTRKAVATEDVVAAVKASPELIGYRAKQQSPEILTRGVPISGCLLGISGQYDEAKLEVKDVELLTAALGEMKGITVPREATDAAARSLTVAVDARTSLYLDSTTAKAAYEVPLLDAHKDGKLEVKRARNPRKVDIDEKDCAVEYESHDKELDLKTDIDLEGSPVYDAERDVTWFQFSSFLVPVAALKEGIAFDVSFKGENEKGKYEGKYQAVAASFNGLLEEDIKNVKGAGSCQIKVLEGPALTKPNQDKPGCDTSSQKGPVDEVIVLLNDLTKRVEALEKAGAELKEGLAAVTSQVAELRESGKQALEGARKQIADNTRAIEAGAKQLDGLTQQLGDWTKESKAQFENLRRADLELSGQIKELAQSEKAECESDIQLTKDQLESEIRAKVDSVGYVADQSSQLKNILDLQGRTGSLEGSRKGFASDLQLTAVAALSCLAENDKAAADWVADVQSSFGVDPAKALSQLKGDLGIQLSGEDWQDLTNNAAAFNKAYATAQLNLSVASAAYSNCVGSAADSSKTVAVSTSTSKVKAPLCDVAKLLADYNKANDALNKLFQ